MGESAAPTRRTSWAWAPTLNAAAASKDKRRIGESPLFFATLSGFSKAVIRQICGARIRFDQGRGAGSRPAASPFRPFRIALAPFQINLAFA